MSFQTHKTFIHLRNIKILLMKSESFLTLHRLKMQLKCSQTQKRSKDIGKAAHVTSVVQPQFYEVPRILFVRKAKKKNFSILLLQITSGNISVALLSMQGCPHFFM